MHLLFVCTGNLCRSPIAEGLALSAARNSLDHLCDGVRIASAGLEAPEGRAMDSLSAAALRSLGGDAGDFRSRRFTAGMAEDADLVITMTRRQRRAVLAATPRGLRRTFTLLEAAELLGRADASGLTDLPLTDRARQLAARLDAARARRRASDADDLMDPIGRPARVHRAVASTIADSLAPLAAVLFPDPYDGQVTGSSGRSRAEQQR